MGFSCGNGAANGRAVKPLVRRSGAAISRALHTDGVSSAIRAARSASVRGACSSMGRLRGGGAVIPQRYASVRGKRRLDRAQEVDAEPPLVVRPHRLRHETGATCQGAEPVDIELVRILGVDALTRR